MVSTKSSKVTYAERVLGAFSHLQREHRKHDIHVATLRAQIKRHAEAKKDTLGPHWTHWVSKAITKLESEGILQHTVPGSVALTLDGKRAVTDARRSLQIGSPQKDKDSEDLSIWKQISTTSRGVKRSRKSFASTRGGMESDSEDETASRANKSPRKRPRATTVGSSPKKSMSKLTKLELQQELASVKKAYAVAIRRPSSPLTDLSDDDDDETAELKEKLKERDQAIENMRRELDLVRNGISREENQGDAPTLQHAAGVTRTQSGSYIPNLSKQPTPAPSTSERDDDYGRAGEFGPENTDMAVDINGQGLPASLGDTTYLSVVTALKSKVQDLQKSAAANLAAILTKETEISDLKKLISDRDAIITSLGEKVLELKTEVNALQESCRVAQETAAKLTLQLQTDADVSKTKLGALETSNANLLHEQETLKLDLEQAKAKCNETENTAEDVRNHTKSVSDELCALKVLQDEQISKIESLVNSLARTSSDAQALRENARMLEASVTNYKAEIQKKDGICQNLESQLKQNGFRIADLGKSVEDMRILLAEANEKAAVAESKNEKLITELSLKDGEMQRYRKDLANGQVEIANWAAKHANDTATLSSTVSEFRNALDAANDDVKRLTTRVQAMENEHLNIQRDLGKKEADLLDKVNILDKERKVKLAIEADLRKHVSMTQELEEKLGAFKTLKEADEATISGLRASFIKFRQTQLKVFGEFEREIISAQ